MGHSGSFIPRWQAVRARLLSCGGQLQPDREQEAIGDGPTARSSLPSLRCPVRMCKGIPYFHFQSRKEIGIRKKLSEVISSSRQESGEKALLGEPQRRCSHPSSPVTKGSCRGLQRLRLWEVLSRWQQMLRVAHPCLCFSVH